MRSPILQDLTEAQREEVIRQAAPRQLQAHERLADQGAPARAFYVIEVGHLKLGQVTADGREVIVRFAGPGDAFGGIVVVGQPVYPVSATSVGPARVLGWSRDVLTSIIAKYPPVRTRILEQIAQHMTDALDRVQELATERVDQRLAKTILRLGANGGRRTAAGTEIVHPITRQELADLVGATLFTVSRVIARWEEDGVLKSARSRIVIADAARLEQLAGSPPD